MMDVLAICPFGTDAYCPVCSAFAALREELLARMIQQLDEQILGASHALLHEEGKPQVDNASR